MATLYRKYRSNTFDEVIGQDPIVTTLTNQIRLGRIGHAYLFTGSRGIGKTSCARIFARAVNCLHPVNGSPCGECEVCKRFAVDNVDIIEMDAASNNGVDDARDIREKVKYLPVACKYKVYIIDEVHMLTGGAFNALLKTIEEPPEHVIFILATTEPQKLPQTILSRCIRFDFKLVPIDVLAKHIASIYDKEGIKYTEEAVEEIARLGEGSVRDALSVADTLASAAAEITTDVVLTLTGAGDTGAIAKLFDCTAACDLKGVLTSIDGLVKSGKSMAAVCRQLIDYTRNVLVCKSVGREAAISGGIINADRASLDTIIAAADKYAMNDISFILAELGAAENGLKYSVNPRVFLETALVKLVCGNQGQKDLLKRIAALENNSASPAEQKKNKLDRTDPRQEGEPVAAPVPTVATAQNPKPSVQSPAPAPTERQQKPSVAEQTATTDDYDYLPPPDDFIPPPPEPDFAPPPIEQARNQAPVRKTAVAGKVTAADEGEFWHLKASAEIGLELFGKIVRALRRSGSPTENRVMRLLARDVKVKERDGYIAFVSPDNVYLQMGEQTVIDVLNSAFDGLGVKKRAVIERTIDDMFNEDILRAKDMFGVDGVVVTD